MLMIIQNGRQVMLATAEIIPFSHLHFLSYILQHVAFFSQSASMSGVQSGSGENKPPATIPTILQSQQRCANPSLVELRPQAVQ